MYNPVTLVFSSIQCNFKCEMCAVIYDSEYYSFSRIASVVAVTHQASGAVCFGALQERRLGPVVWVTTWCVKMALSTRSPTAVAFDLSVTNAGAKLISGPPNAAMTGTLPIHPLLHNRYGISFRRINPTLIVVHSVYYLIIQISHTSR